MKAPLIRSISMAVFCLTLGGCGAVKGKQLAEDAIKVFHEQLDKGDFNTMYSAAHADLKAASSEKEFIALLEAVHRKLGIVKNSESAGWNVNSFNLKTNVVLTCKTKFADGDATETFTYRVEGDKAVLVGYNISSMALITK